MFIIIDESNWFLDINMHAIYIVFEWELHLKCLLTVMFWSWSFKYMLKNFHDSIDYSCVIDEQDSFTRCFKSNPPEPWNWNVYLFPLWCCGVVIRYLILFPVRLAIELLESNIELFDAWWLMFEWKFTLCSFLRLGR